eukprot:COSAG01_NODE_391_length_17672_cov_4.507369_7_plen_127_part_00
MGVDGGTQPVALTHEAARAVKTLATHHCVEALGRIALGHALGKVLVISVSRVEPHAKHLDPARDGDLVPRCVHHFVHHAVADALLQVVAPGRLIEDVRDDAIAGGAEFLVRRDVGESTWLEHADVE